MQEWMISAPYSNQNILKGTLEGINDKGEINVIHGLILCTKIV